MLYITGGTVLAWDSLSVSPVSVPSLGLCNTDQLAPNVVREAIKVENIKNEWRIPFQRLRLSVIFRSL